MPRCSAPDASRASHSRRLRGAARIPPCAGQYNTMPVIGCILRLSAGGKLSDDKVSISPGNAASILAASGIAFVVLDTREPSPISFNTWNPASL